MAKSVQDGFEAFIDKLVPLSTEHTKATSHKGSVESCLTNKFEMIRMFETGSFGNGTGVRHHSDSDYFAIIPAKNLYGNSAISLREVKEALQATFSSTTGIVVDTPAIQIPFGNYASENLEVAPCYFKGLVEASNRIQYASYGIAGGDGGWIISSPDAHNKYVQDIDKLLYNKVKPLIRLIKAWKFYNSAPIISFYLELRTAKYASTEKAIVYDLDVCKIFEHLEKIELANMQDPMSISGLISPSKTEAKKIQALSKISTAATRARKAVNARLENKIDDAFYWWNMVFDNNFPAR